MKIHSFGKKPRGSWHILSAFASCEATLEYIDKLLKVKGWEIHQMDTGSDYVEFCIKKRKGKMKDK